MVATKVEDNILIPHTTAGLAIPVIVATSYMVNLHEIIIWPNLLILLNLKLKVRIHPHLKESFSLAGSMRITFVHYYKNYMFHDSIHDSGGERSDSFKESKICLNRRQNRRIMNRFNTDSQQTKKLKSHQNKRLKYL